MVLLNGTATSWRNQDDLSGVTPMDTGAGMEQWSKEQNATTSASPSTSWADFSSFSAKQQNSQWVTLSIMPIGIMKGVHTPSMLYYM